MAPMSNTDDDMLRKEHLREQRAAVRQLREALDELPPLARSTFARACAHEGHSLEELYEFLDSTEERLGRMLVNASPKAPL
jgi:DNA-directed RNA polymerase specialized sigma24 family protein